MTQSSPGGWYNANEMRRYPLVDGASAVGSNGQTVPEGFLADVIIRYASNLRTPAGFSLANAVPFLSAASASPYLLSATFALQHDNAVLPMATVQAVRPLSSGAPIAVKPLIPGVAGWVVFGSNVVDDFFTSLPDVTAGGVVSSAVQMVNSSTGFNGLGITYDELLQGLVALSGESGFEVLACTEPGEEFVEVKQTSGRDPKYIPKYNEDSDPFDYTVRPRMRRVLGDVVNTGKTNRCIVLRLSAQTAGQYDMSKPSAMDGDREDVIRTINNVSADPKTGIITIEIKTGGTGLVVGGKVSNAVNQEVMGVLLSSLVGVSDTCPPKAQFELTVQNNPCVEPVEIVVPTDDDDDDDDDDG